MTVLFQNWIQLLQPRIYHPRIKMYCTRKELEKKVREILVKDQVY
jgi:hypothetical protein